MLNYSFSNEALRFASEPAKTATCFVHGLNTDGDTFTVCLPEGSLRVAGALPTRSSSTYTSAPSGTEVTTILPFSLPGDATRELLSAGLVMDGSLGTAFGSGTEMAFSWTLI